MPTLPQGRLWVLSSSLAFSSVAMGLSITLLHAERSTTISANSKAKWPQQGPQSQPQPQPQPQPPFLQPRNPGPFTVNGDEFHGSEILAIVSSALNLLLATVLIVASSLKRKTIISAVAVEAPCIYLVSFMWLATGAYAEHISGGNPGSQPYLNPHECTRHKILEGFAFFNWIQLMLYANTLLTVATICHVRKRSVWLLPVTELPTLGAPALTFDSGPEMAFDSPFIVKTDESETLMPGASRPTVHPRTPSHFRSRVTFPQHPNHQPRTLIAVPSLESLAPSVSTQTDVTSSQTPVSHARLSTYHRIVPTGEPPTYSGPDAGYGADDAM